MPLTPAAQDDGPGLTSDQQAVEQDCREPGGRENRHHNRRAVPAPCHQGVVNSTEFNEILPGLGRVPADMQFIATMPGYSSLLLRSPASRVRQTRRGGLARRSEIAWVTAPSALAVEAARSEFLAVAPGRYPIRWNRLAIHLAGWNALTSEC